MVVLFKKNLFLTIKSILAKILALEQLKPSLKGYIERTAFCLLMSLLGKDETRLNSSIPIFCDWIEINFAILIYDGKEFDCEIMC